MISSFAKGGTDQETAHMRMTQILGVVALVIGLVLLGFAYHASNAPMEQVSDALTGRYTNQTMWYLILGIAAAVGGVLLVAFGRRK